MKLSILVTIVYRFGFKRSDGVYALAISNLRLMEAVNFEGSNKKVRGPDSNSMFESRPWSSTLRCFCDFTV